LEPTLNYAKVGVQARLSLYKNYDLTYIELKKKIFFMGFIFFDILSWLSVLGILEEIFTVINSVSGYFGFGTIGALNEGQSPLVNMPHKKRDTRNGCCPP
jgi:hypothetical protein